MPTIDPAALIAAHTAGAAAALAAHVTYRRARAEKQARFNERGLPRTVGLSRPTRLPVGA